MFSQSTITAVNPPVYQGSQVFLSWQSSSPAGTWFQVYFNQHLAWYGKSLSTWIATPTSGVSRVDVGTVDDGEEATDFGSSLPGGPTRRVALSWTGGVFEGSDIAGFHIYMSGVANGSIDYAKVVATIAAYPAGLIVDGFGQSGWGQFGFGNDGGDYGWESQPLVSGTWSFAVRPFDTTGNEGTAVTTSAIIQVPPLPPALNAQGQRLTYVVDDFGRGPGFGEGGFGLSAPGSAQVTLNWLPSPG